MSGNLKGSGGDIAPFSQSSFPWKKAVSAVFITGTHVICSTSCYLISENVNADAANPGTAAFHDGQNLTGRLVWHDQALANHAHGCCFKIPIYCDKGLTLVATSVTNVAVQWVPGPRLP